MSVTPQAPGRAPSPHHPHEDDRDLDQLSHVLRAQRSGVTENLLTCAFNERDGTPYTRLAEAVPASTRVLA